MADAQKRGRARGRAKTPATAPAAAAPPPAEPKPLTQAMGAPKPVQPSSGRATHRGAGRPIDETVMGTVTQRMSGMTVGPGGNGSSGNGSGNGAPVGRGNMRGKRQIPIPNIKTRPAALTSKKGSAGQPVSLMANYFAVESKPDWHLHQYRVDFAPDIDLTRERKQLLRVHQPHIGEYLFDGTVLYCTKMLTTPDKPTVELFSKRETDDSQIRITLKHVGQVTDGDHQYIQLFNILTKRCLGLLNLQLINRDYFDPKAKVEVREYYLELWPGYKTTMRQHEQKVLMCAEITHKVMRTDSCFHLLCDISRNNAREYKMEFTKAVVGSVVLTDYNNQTYTISDVSWTENPQSTFDRNGTPTSYMQYFKERYNITIKDKSQPLLVSKRKPRERRALEQAAQVAAAGGDPNIIKLIPELCRMTGLTDEMRSNFNLMRAMATHTRIGPGERINRLMTMNRRLNGEERVRAEFNKWQLRLSEKLVDIPGRVLPPEAIVLGNNKTVESGPEADWTKHLRSNPMFVMPQGGLSNWAVLYPYKVASDVEAFVDTLYKAGQGMRFQIAQPEYVELNDDKNQTYVEKLDQVISNMNPQLIFVVLLNQKADRYSAIKKKSLVDRAVPTQVLLAKNLNKKGVMSIATKVAIQINCKIGGAPWSVVMPLGGAMVIGFDVCHDSKSKGHSYGAMVASLNKPMSRYFSAVSHHSTGEELSNDLSMNIVKALHSYRKHNNTYPSHIIIYRDGVGDGQIPYVFDHEVQQIQAAVQNVYGQPPKIAFVIVCKKINTRVFANNNNPRPGTVVDDVITQPERYDFFIVSQFVNQGTVSPTSYNVIHDTLGLDPDKLQRLTFKLTHCYYNWSGTVRVPAPVQYAHKLAFLVSQSLHRAPNASLEELLFFL